MFAVCMCMCECWKNVCVGGGKDQFTTDTIKKIQNTGDITENKII